MRDSTYQAKALAQLRKLAESRPDCPEAAEVLRICDEATSEARMREETAKQVEADLRAIWGIG